MGNQCGACCAKESEQIQITASFEARIFNDNESEELSDILPILNNGQNILD